jgi:hypothetical protein
VDPTHSLNIEGSSLALEALGFSVVTISAFLEHSSSIPSEVSAPETFLEKFNVTDILFPSQKVVGGFPTANLFFFVQAEGGGLFAPSSLEELVETEVAIMSSTAATLFSFVSRGFVGPAIKSGSFSARQTSFGGGFFIGFQVSSGSTFFGVENAAQSESRLNKFVAATQA